MLLTNPWRLGRDWIHRDWCTVDLPWRWRYPGQSRQSASYVVDVINLITDPNFLLRRRYGLLFGLLTATLFLMLTNLLLAGLIESSDCATSVLKLRCCYPGHCHLLGYEHRHLDSPAPNAFGQRLGVTTDLFWDCCWRLLQAWGWWAGRQPITRNYNYLMRNQWLLSCLAPEPDEWHDAGFPLPTWLILTTVLAVYNNMLFRPTDCCGFIWTNVIHLSFILLMTMANGIYYVAFSQ